MMELSSRRYRKVIWSRWDKFRPNKANLEMRRDRTEKGNEMGREVRQGDWRNGNEGIT